MALLGLLAGLVISWWQQQKRIRALSQEKERERAEKEAALAAKEYERAEKEAAWMKEQLERCTKEKLQEELRWRKKQYLEPDVILDPDTAHPNLLISEDQRSLNYTLERQRLPDNPKRFQDRFCVLGCESFTSGRHFWEVEVGDRKEWHLGVCRENVERKYYATITPENGFWTIALLGGHEFQARTDSRTKLTVVNHLKRVGVFLDYERGE
ncbi:PREDICTED: butyrophilin subfamily 3 member A3-like, partial [Myotis brandtii]|uniref:butyrophilin subfamily 3 member A3-like n=1 Tax=Myotis brandtii TaxID=109478 RepID=UPI000703ECED